MAKVYFQLGTKKMLFIIDCMCDKIRIEKSYEAYNNKVLIFLS